MTSLPFSRRGAIASVTLANHILLGRKDLEEINGQTRENGNRDFFVRSHDERSSKAPEILDLIYGMSLAV